MNILVLGVELEDVGMIKKIYIIFSSEKPFHNGEM